MTTTGGYLRLHPDLVAKLEEHQRVADRQASRWIERELVGLLRGRTPFGGSEPRITYTRKQKLATLSHGI